MSQVHGPVLTDDAHTADAPGQASAASAASAPTVAARAGIARSAPPQWWAPLVGASAMLSLAVVVALWLSNQGLQGMTDPWTTSTSLGRLTGLLASDLMLLQVLLIARIPWAERVYGQDTLTRWHRLVGTASFSLMLAHIVLVSVGYSGSLSGAVDEFVDLVLTAPGMFIALAGTIAITGVVVTSIRWARRRLRYESWHLLHLYAYLGTGLALPHQLWTGTDFRFSPAARAYWWTLWSAAAGAVIIYRLLVPAWRSHRHRLVVERVVTEAPGVVSVYLTGRALDRLPVRAGHFFQWRFLAGPGWSRAHPYSLSAAPTGDHLRITIKNLGDGSAAAANLRPGTRALVEGPYGCLTGQWYRGGKVTLIGCGVGITPLRALAEDLPYAPGTATMIYRSRSDQDVLFREELEDLSGRRGLRVVHVLGRRAGPTSWQPLTAEATADAEALQRLVPDLSDHDVYICGPTTWTEAVRRAVAALGVPPERVHAERFGW